MSVSVELLTTAEIQEHYFLPWQKLYRERWHFPWQSFQWWTVLSRRHPNPDRLPYWAVATQDRQPIGIVPLFRDRKNGRSPWRLDLRPFSGGGVLGRQVTATLNAVIAKLQRHPQSVSRWELHFDPQDDYLKNRFETAFQRQRLIALQSAPQMEGWILPGETPEHWDDLPVLQDNIFVWANTNIPGMDIPTINQRRWNLWDLHQGSWDSVVLSGSGDVQLLAWRIWLRPSIDIDRLPELPPSYFVPWGVTVPRDYQGNRRELTESLLQQVLQQSAQWLLPESFSDFLQFPEGLDLVQRLHQQGRPVQRWITQSRNMGRDSMWRQLQRRLSQKKKAPASLPAMAELPEDVLPEPEIAGSVTHGG